jgi:phage-related protein
MAEAIVIKIALDAGDITRKKGEIRQALQSALSSAVPDAQSLGKKIGDALSAGITEGLRNAQRLRSQLDNILSPTARHTKSEDAERKHQQRLVEIEAKANAQRALLRERAAIQAERDALRFAQAQERAIRRSAPPDSVLGFFKRYSSTVREAGESIQQAGYFLSGLSAGIIGLGRSAVQSTIQIDQQVNVLKALTGSAENAEKRFAALVALSQKTPGLTTNLAATLDAQLRVANVSVGTIDRLLPAIGRLNAVAPLADPQRFSQNLVQLVTQNFERTDLKELIGQSPLAGEIIKNLFNVDSPINGKAIREAAQKLGLTTTDAFFAAFAAAAENNPKLAKITESLGTQFEKLRDRVLVSLRPLGLAIIQTLAPLVEKAIPIIERLSKAFAELPDSTRQIIVAVGVLAAAIGPLVIAFGSLVQTVGAFGNLLTVFAGATGAGASGGLAGVFGGLAPILLAATAALSGFAVAFATDFGNIRSIAADAFSFLREQFGDVVTFWREIAPDINRIFGPVLDALVKSLEVWSDIFGSIWRGQWETFKDVVRESLDVVRELVRAGLNLLSGDIQGFRDSLSKAWREAWDAVITLSARAIVNLSDTITTGFRSLLSKTGLAREIGQALGGNLANGIVGGLAAAFPSTSSLLSGLVGNARSFLGLKSQQRQAGRDAAQRVQEGRNLDADIITDADLAAASVNFRDKIAEARNKPKAAGLKAETEGAASKVRALRQAQLQFEREALEQQTRLAIDANKRELDAVKAFYEDRKLTLSQFYDEKIRLERENTTLTIGLTQQEIAATEKSLAAAKAGTPEKIRLEEQLIKLRADLAIQTRELTEVEIANQREFVKAATEARNKLLKETQGLALPATDNISEQLRTAEKLTPEQLRARETLLAAQRASLEYSQQDANLRVEELRIQNLLTLGILNEAEAKQATLAIQRQYRDELIRALEVQQQAEVDPLKITQLQAQIEQLRTLGAELTPLEGFFKGFRSQAETLAESFERIGASFKDKVLGVVDKGIDSLTKKLGFFKDLVGDILKSLARLVISSLFSPGGGGGGGTGGGGGGGGFFSQIANIFRGGRGGGAASSANPLSLATAGIGNILSQGFSAISAPRSASGIDLPILPSPVSTTSQGIQTAISLSGGGSKGFLGLLGQNFSGLFKGIGFGLPKGSGGGALAGALPLLGASLGAGLGTDRLTSVLGGIAGGLLGVGLTAAPAIIGTGGALSSLGFLAPLFSNPITAIAAAAALPAIFLLGRARQRRRDERSSGDFLQQAIDGIRDLRKQVETDQIQVTVSQARELFNRDILDVFKQQIGTLKTKSVRESRLKNQTRDLQALFEKEVIPEVQKQATRAKTAARLVPEFAFGGIVPGTPTPGRDTVLSWLSPGEMVLTVRHQQAIAAMAGSDVFARAGVPGGGAPTPDGGQAFALGGLVTTGRRAAEGAPIVINLQGPLWTVGSDTASKLLDVAASTDDGRRVIIRANQEARRNREVS